jgi:hypothetical protein|tara:strand:+ start:639 stop:968 length:330 start_codon:yes stop_codon:yes gene_type:complete
MAKMSRKELRKIIKESFDASYDAGMYIPSLEKAMAPLVGIAAELKSASWGEHTDVIHNEMKDAMSSLDLVLAALRETQVEYKTGPMGGKLRKTSDTLDVETGAFLKSDE